MRPILKTLSIVGPLPNCTGNCANFKIRMTDVKKTIVKSKMFHESLKYAFFNAIILIKASSENIPMKT